MCGHSPALAPLPPAFASSPHPTRPLSCRRLCVWVADQERIGRWLAAGQAGHHVVAGIAGEPVSPEVMPPRKAPSAGPPPAIPRIVHQTFKAKDLIKSVDRVRMQTWEALNPTWTIMLWDDRACTTFVQTEYPELYPAYAGLAKNVERADFFRYLVVYHYGGLYADTDVTCLQPLDVWLPPSAELVVGLENEFPSADLAGSRQYACARQYLQWAFLARKSAPLLKAAVDRILHPESALPEEGSKARKADLTTLELTGPGMWTQEIFKYVGTLMDDGSSLDSVLLLPRVSKVRRCAGGGRRRLGSLGGAPGGATSTLSSLAAELRLAPPRGLKMETGPAGPGAGAGAGAGERGRGCWVRRLAVEREEERGGNLHVAPGLEQGAARLLAGEAELNELLHRFRRWLGRARALRRGGRDRRRSLTRRDAPRSGCLG